MSLLRRGGPVLAAVALLAALPGVSAAGRPHAPDPRAAVEAELGEASREEQAAVQAALGARDRRRAAEAEVAELDRGIATAAGQAREAEARLARLAAQAREVAAQLELAEADLALAEARFSDTVVRIYKGGGGADAYSTLVGGASSLHEVVVGNRYLEDVGRRAEWDYEWFVAQRDRVREARAQVRSDTAAAQGAREAAAVEQARLQELRQQQAGTLAAARAAEAAETAALAEVRARKGEFERRLAEMQNTSRGVGAILGERPGGGFAPGALRMPASGPITSPFGWRVHPIYGDRRLHAGIDIGAPQGAPVVAAAGGTVVIAGTQGGYGNAVVIDHGGGLATLSAHLSRISVRVGQQVDAAQQVGAVGSTGNSTGPHLHFEVRLNGAPVDPMPYL